jgi:hypothetical protein
MHAFSRILELLFCLTNCVSCTFFILKGIDRTKNVYNEECICRICKGNLYI